jgi:hypothetical protein
VATSIQLEPAALGVAFLSFVDDGQRSVGVFETGGFQHQAADVAVEVEEELLADGAVVLQNFRVLAGLVEPHQRVRQIEKSNAALADDLQVGGAAEGGGFLPLRGDVAAAGDLCDGRLQARQQSIVFGVSSNEEPYDHTFAPHTYSAIVIGHAHRPERKCRVERFELEAWMRRIDLEASIGLASTLLYAARELRKIAAERWMQSRDHN